MNGCKCQGLDSNVGTRWIQMLCWIKNFIQVGFDCLSNLDMTLYSYHFYININILHTSTLMSIPSIALISIQFQRMYPCNINICIHPISTFISIKYQHLYLAYINISVHPIHCTHIHSVSTYVSMQYQHLYPSYIIIHICPFRVQC